MKRMVAVAATVVAAALVSTTTALAATDPYVSGATGYDAAGGQCGATPPPAQFAILDATGGRPFTASSCLSSEAAAAGSDQLSLYFNTGYSGAYGRDVTTACNSAATAAGYSGKTAQAYAIGCSEAAYAAGHAAGLSPAAWWLDVETSNSWSSANAAYNVATIQGAVSEMHALSAAPVGIYSSASAWQTITGGGTVNGVDASWVLAGNGFACGGTAFSQSPVWVVQGGTTTSAGVTFDTDTAC